MSSNDEDSTMGDRRPGDGHDAGATMSRHRVEATSSDVQRETARSDPSRQRASSTSRVAERAARGKAARADVPRASHGDWEPAAAPA